MRTLGELARGVPRLRVRRGGDAAVAKVRVDSRAVEPGDLFVAIPGENVDGRAFADDALARGAAGIVTAEGAPAPASGAWLTTDDPRAAAGHLAAAAWGHPSRRMDVVGFTGTNGKTTSTFLLGAIARAAGRTPAVIGTLGMFLPGGKRPHVRTTPEAPELQAAFADALDAGVDLAAIEVSSHALDLRRVDGTAFAAAAFLNLSAEHLDWHGTMDRYGASKMRLFSELLPEGRTAAGRPRAALNGMDPWADRFRDVVEDAVVFATGEDRAAEVTARGLRIGPGGSRFDLVTPDGDATVELPLPGRHNVENALAAAATAWCLGLATPDIARGLTSAQAPPGRFERVHAGAFDAYVDYAHTEDALALAMEAARAVTKGRLFVVLGCGGSRDTGKRAGMGRIAAAGADTAIFTTDNPRDEDPRDIIEAMKSQADPAKVEVVLDREEALARAVALAGPGDVVLACGKGHEEYQEIAGKRLPFPEREILGRLAAERDGAAR